MRIIAGTRKGMRLLEPPGPCSRPILDRVKESLFNILATYGLPGGKVVADLFCGVGSLGLEALSRGASLVTFVESDQRLIEVLHKNLLRAGMSEKAKVVTADAFSSEPAWHLPDRLYDLVFIDPPYVATADTGPGSRLYGLLEIVSGETTQEALVVVRTHRLNALPQQCGQLQVIDRREYGKMALTILARFQPSVVRVYRALDGQ
ncbi:MAG: 16S rRNA (guanine(966)-N(2))-methyltransferase RsmD [Sedimentisphaerales bacterium]|jgi:16S rRNA (guanine(966)-N(2))-methyltransferase RsmD|nr:16S rRNA (guanine(966)-N(2))-methyltransferase RsmD [Sedimentisphaerales bacterium]